MISIINHFRGNIDGLQNKSIFDLFLLYLCHAKFFYFVISNRYSFVRLTEDSDRTQALTCSWAWAVAVVRSTEYGLIKNVHFIPTFNFDNAPTSCYLSILLQV